MRRSGEIRRVCVVRLGGMGDILLATPALRAVAERFDTDQIDYVVGKGMQDAVTGIPYVRRVLTFNKDGQDARPANFRRFLADLGAQRYDLFLNFHPSVKTVLMGLASRAPKVITFKKDRRRQPDTGRVRHAIDDFTKELKPLGIDSVADRRMDFFVSDAARASVREKLRDLGGIGGDAPYLVANPAATRDINRWPPDRFTALLNRLSSEVPGLRLVLSGGPGDVELASGIAGGVRPEARLLNLAGRVSVKELGALLAGADCVVTADTGPLHIASAVGAPIVCLSGAADPDRTGPTAARDLVVINRDLPCVSCQGRTCARGDIACMTQMPVEWVFDAVLRRLKEK